MYTLIGKCTLEPCLLEEDETYFKSTFIILFGPKGAYVTKETAFPPLFNTRCRTDLKVYIHDRANVPNPEMQTVVYFNRNIKYWYLINIWPIMNAEAPRVFLYLFSPRLIFIYHGVSSVISFFSIGTSLISVKQKWPK